MGCCVTPCPDLSEVQGRASCPGGGTESASSGLLWDPTRPANRTHLYGASYDKPNSIPAAKGRTLQTGRESCHSAVLCGVGRPWEGGTHRDPRLLHRPPPRVASPHPGIFPR